MPEVVGTFVSAEPRQERANGPAETGDRSLGHLAQVCLEFAEGHLDRVEVAGLLGQVAKRRVDLLDRLTHACTFEIIYVLHYDNVAAPECSHESLLNIGKKHLRVHGTIDTIR